ncbi:MAG: acyl-CoA dehydrogenase, partial [Specibacter sp.]
NELTSLALQIHGGMGFIEETGAAQHVRDVRIAGIYEGTNGIQAADLVGRKLGIRGGASMLEFLGTMRDIDGDLAEAGAAFDSIREELGRQFDALETATQWMLRTAPADPNAVLAGSTPYLRMWGLCAGAWMLARAAVAAQATGDTELAESQLVLARFHAQQLLPQSASLLGAATAGSEDLFALDAHQLSGSSRKVRS